MLSKKTIAAGLIAVTTLAAVPANAAGLSFQFGFGSGPQFSEVHSPRWDRDRHRGWRQDHRGPRWAYGRVSPREVRWNLRRHGYHHIRFLDRRGRFYEVRASKRHRAYLLTVSARSGEIVDRQRIRRGGYRRWR